MAMLRRALAVACLAALTAVDSSAFDFAAIHVEVTRAALTAFLDNLSRELQRPALRQELEKTPGVRVAAFSAAAMAEIVNANKAMDTDDCGDKDNFSVPAVPCNSPTEGAAALAYLAKEPPEEHFDAEKIQESSDFVFAARAAIHEHLKAGNFVGARKALGRALHTLQDFYAHSNYVELSVKHRSPNYERRLGAGPDSFSNGLRVADEKEAVCVEGEYLFTDQRLIEAIAEQRARAVLELKSVTADDPLGPDRTKLLNARIAQIDALSTYIQKWLKNPALTTGFFTLDSTLGFITLPALPGYDPSEITEAGKCRHGWQRLGVDNAGIHKDTADRTYHAEARELATYHTMRFLVEVMAAPELRTDADTYAFYLLGLLGYAPDIDSFRLGIPGAPNNESWDTAIGSVARLLLEGINGLKNIQPDIYVCIEPVGGRGMCAPVCEDADWSTVSSTYECARTLPVPSTPVRVLVREVDSGQARRVIADFRVENPTACNPFYRPPVGPPAPAPQRVGGLPVATPRDGACRIDLEPERSVWVQFQPRGAPSAPSAPPSASGSAPGAGGSTGPAGGGTTPGGNGQGPAGPGSAPLGPGSQSVALGPASTGSGPASGPTGSTPGSVPPGSGPRAAAAPPGAAGGAAPPRTYTPLDIDAALGLRDQDNCIGPDTFFPPGTALSGSPLGQQLGPDQANRVYQMAAFAMATSDKAAKQALLNGMQSRVGDDAFFGAMTLVITDVAQSRAVVAADQNMATDFASRLVSTGLNGLLPTARPQAALALDVESWILRRLTGPLVSRALDMMSAGAGAITAECTLNQLAKEGFTEVAIGQ